MKLSKVKAEHIAALYNRIIVADRTIREELVRRNTTPPTSHEARVESLALVDRWINMRSEAAKALRDVYGIDPVGVK